MLFIIRWKLSFLLRFKNAICDFFSVPNTIFFIYLNPFRDLPAKKENIPILVDYGPFGFLHTIIYGPLEDWYIGADTFLR